MTARKKDLIQDEEYTDMDDIDFFEDEESPEDAIPDVTDDEDLAIGEDLDLEEVDVDTVQEVVLQLETILDTLVMMNKNRELSRVIKLLQSATRFLDEIITTDDLMVD